MFSHMTIGASDLARAIAFYDVVLAPLGIERLPVKYATWASWQRPGEAPKLWVGLPFNKMPTHPGNGWMAAFSASSRKAVDEAYAAAISAGAEDEGAPGPVHANKGLLREIAGVGLVVRESQREVVGRFAILLHGALKKRGLLGGWRFNRLTGCFHEGLPVLPHQSRRRLAY